MKMKNLGKYIMTVFIIASMFVLVTQQINVIQWDKMVTKETMIGSDPNPFIMTNVSVDSDGNTIVKTLDSNGFVDLAENTHSKHQKSYSTNDTATKTTTSS